MPTTTFKTAREATEHEIRKARKPLPLRVLIARVLGEPIGSGSWQPTNGIRATDPAKTIRGLLMHSVADDGTFIRTAPGMYGLRDRHTEQVKGADNVAKRNTVAHAPKRSTRKPRTKRTRSSNRTAAARVVREHHDALAAHAA